MYSIVMHKDKSLIKGCGISIYQGETLMDKLQFLIPKEYNGFDLSEFTVDMNYTLPGNVQVSETLSLNDELLKENHYVYTIPVHTKMSTFAGDIRLFLSFKKIDELVKKKYQMCTSEITLTIKQRNGAYNPLLGYGVIDTTSGSGEYDIIEF